MDYSAIEIEEKKIFTDFEADMSWALVPYEPPVSRFHDEIGRFLGDRLPLPIEAAAREAVPSEAVPSEAVPSEAVPSEAAPSETVPSEAVPSEAAPSEAAPSEAVPSEAAPSEAVPSEAAPSGCLEVDPELDYDSEEEMEQERMLGEQEDCLSELRSLSGA
jgi:hypothetical protein